MGYSLVLKEKCPHSSTHVPLGVGAPVSAALLTSCTGCVWKRDGLECSHTSQSISPNELSCSGAERSCIINTASPEEGGRAPWQLEDELRLLAEGIPEEELCSSPRLEAPEDKATLV